MRPRTPKGTRSITTTRMCRGCSTAIAATTSTAPPGARRSAIRARTGASTSQCTRPSGSMTGPRRAPESRSTTDPSPPEPTKAPTGVFRTGPSSIRHRSARGREPAGPPPAPDGAAAGVRGDHQLRAPAPPCGPHQRAQPAVTIERGDQLLGPGLTVRAGCGLLGRRRREAGLAAAGDLLAVAEVGGSGAVHLDRRHYLAGDVPQPQQGPVHVLALAAPRHGLLDRERADLCAAQRGQVTARSERGPEIAGQGTDIGARGAGDGDVDVQERALGAVAGHLEAGDPHRTSCQLDGFARAGTG